MNLIEPRKLSRAVIDRLVEAIETGVYKPGERLPAERDLMAVYGIGRPAVREALQALQAMGLIKITHGARARVVEPAAAAIIGQMSEAMIQLLNAKPSGLDELKEARLLLECGLVRIAASRATAEGLQVLLLAKQACETAHGAALVAADMAFHRQIAAISGNSFIAAATAGMLEWLTRFKRSLVAAPGAERLTLAEHQRIYDAIAARDADAAALAMTEHLTRANALYSVLLQRPG